MLREQRSLAVGDGFGHVLIYKVSCHILEPGQMDCKEKVHLLGMDGALGSKMPAEIFLCHRCCLADKAFTMDEAGAPSWNALAGLLGQPEFQICSYFPVALAHSTASMSICAPGGSGGLAAFLG